MSRGNELVRAHHRDIDVRIGLVSGTAIEKVIAGIQLSGEPVGDTITEESRRVVIFAPGIDRRLRHVTVVNKGDTSYVRYKIISGMPTSDIDGIEHMIFFDPHSRKEEQKAIKLGLNAVGGDPGKVRFSPVFDKSRLARTFSFDGRNIAVAGDTCTIVNGQPMPRYERYADKTLEVLELKMVGIPEGELPDYALLYEARQQAIETLPADVIDPRAGTSKTVWVASLMNDKKNKRRR